MKSILFALLTTTLFTTAHSQNEHQQALLDKFIAANNVGTREAIGQFVKDTYHPELLARVNFEAQIDFYAMRAEDFGKLKSVVYQKIEEKPFQFVA